MKILRFQPPADQHHPEGVYRVLLENLDTLYSTAKRLTGRADLAEDLVQETARELWMRFQRSKTSETPELGSSEFC